MGVNSVLPINNFIAKNNVGYTSRNPYLKESRVI